MSNFTVGDIAVKAFVLAFSIAGVVLLSIIALLSDVDEVAIADLSEHSGETVMVRGAVMGESRHESGSSSVFIFGEADGNVSEVLEVIVERSYREREAGEHVAVKGQVLKDDERVWVVAQSDRSVRVYRSEPVLAHSGHWTNGTLFRFHGVVTSSGRLGWDGFEASVLVGASEEGPWTTEVRVEGSYMDEVPRTGDTVRFIGLTFPGFRIACFGRSSFEVIARAAPRTEELVSIVEGMGVSPSSPPVGPLIVDGYLRYEPRGGVLFLGEEMEGASISVRARVGTDLAGVHKGDLVRCSNCSLSWTSNELRYDLVADTLEVMEAHGPWTINLASLQYGVGQFEGSIVRVDGELSMENGTLLLVDGPSSIIVRGNVTGAPEGPAAIEGTVLLDPSRNVYYIEAETRSESL